jgi:flagellar hook-basal body complex protein FliE
MAISRLVDTNPDVNLDRSIQKINDKQIKALQICEMLAPKRSEEIRRDELSEALKKVRDERQAAKDGVTKAIEGANDAETKETEVANSEETPFDDEFRPKAEVEEKPKR